MKTITATELKKRLDKDEVLLIDVREPAEYRSEHIDGSCPAIPNMAYTPFNLRDKKIGFRRFFDKILNFLIDTILLILLKKNAAKSLDFTGFPVQSFFTKYSSYKGRRG